MIIKNNANKECIIFIFITLLILTPIIKPKKDKKIILVNNKKSTFNTLLIRSENIANIEFKNVNFQYYNKSPKPLFLQFCNEFNFQSIESIYKTIISQKGLSDIRDLDEISPRA